MRLLHIIPLIGLASCGWNFDTEENRTLNLPLWDAQGALAGNDGLYIPLTRARDLVYVEPDGTWEPVDLGAGALAELSASPGGGRVAALVDRFACDVEDPREARRIDWVEECPAESLVTRREVGLLQSGELSTTAPIPPHFNQLTWAPAGPTAIAWLDVGVQIDLQGVVDLTSVAVLDLAGGTATPISVGFAPDGVLFTDAGDRAVVLSRSEVAVVDLTGDAPVLEVVFPLTLDPDDMVDPVGVALANGGSHALISVRDRPDLYILDLEAHAVNLVSLSGNPSAMYVDTDTEKTVFVYRNRAVVDVLEHTYFDLETLQLDEAMTNVADVTDGVLLYREGQGHDAYLLELTDNKLWEYRLENPALDLRLSPASDFAIALTRAEGGFGEGIEGLYDANPGMEVLDLRADATGDLDTDTHPFLLESEGVGVAFAESPTALEVLVLQQGQDYLYALDLFSGQPRELELPAAPVAIGAIGDTFYITHDSDLGLVSFLQPAGDELVTAEGFGVCGLFEFTAFEEAP